MSEATKICLSDFTLDALTAYLVSLGQPKFRAKQIFKWLHQKLVTDFSQMTDQPKTLLAQLAGKLHHRSAHHPPPPAIQGRYGQISAAIGRRQLHRDGFDALQVWQHGLRVHPGGLRHGLPLLRLYPGRPRAGFDRGRDCLRNLHRTEGLRRAGLSHRFNGHR